MAHRPASRVESGSSRPAACGENPHMPLGGDAISLCRSDRQRNVPGNGRM